MDVENEGSKGGVDAMTILKEPSLHHLEIADYLIQCIRSGVYKVNDKIPSENELCHQFRVNRHVVRHAIHRITNLGWVTPIQGKGSFVSSKPKPILYALSSKTRFTENMESQGVQQYRNELLHWEQGMPTEEERQHLQLSMDDEVYRLEILRFIEQHPFSLATTVLPVEEFPDFGSYLDNYESLYQILIDAYHFQPVRSQSMLDAVLPSLVDAELLGIPENVPIVKIASIMNHPTGYPIEYSVARIRSDMHQCLIEF